MSSITLGAGGAFALYNLSFGGARGADYHSVPNFVPPWKISVGAYIVIYNIKLRSNNIIITVLYWIIVLIFTAALPRAGTIGLVWSCNTTHHVPRQVN